MVKEYSPELDLYLPNPVTEGTDNFNLDTILNDNWQKIDAFAQAQKTMNEDVAEDITQIGNSIGNLATLTTDDKTNLVLAMNEVLQKLTTHSAEGTTGAHVIGNITGLQSALNGKESTLNPDQKRKITFGTTEPTGGSDGDVYFQYE
ncbi:hypothetical protein [Jeotgalibacillus terrae]|uniref:Uncharacterized protein n=1 Tax=Jeotgalibacillus terrae TaxID=587735 RepID=A0ABW5ZEW1_9BACL|nr:hypothetical protein [Jeotgalibacillus terrae]MBM7577659.1 hypothetical protein [Jeotgalibacillus terrae]